MNARVKIDIMCMAAAMILTLLCVKLLFPEYLLQENTLLLFLWYSLVALALFCVLLVGVRKVESLRPKKEVQTEPTARLLQNTDDLEGEYASMHPYFWKFAMNSIPDFFYAKDVEGRYTGQNRSMLDLYGHTTEYKVLGKTNYDLYTGILDKELLDKLEETDRRACYSSVPMVAEEIVPMQDGGVKYYESMKCSYRSPEGEILGMISVSRDITSRKQVEQALLQSRAEANAANEAKSNFLANMSHEIRTPMNGILGLLHLTLNTPLEQKQRNYLEKCDLSTQSLLRIINDILDFSKIEAAKMEIEKVPFDLKQVACDAVELFQPLCEEKKLELRFVFAPDIPDQVLGDPLRVGQVINNLLSNAIKFTSQGFVRLGCSLHKRAEHIVTVKVEVEDSGIGMTEEELRQLFLAFTQAQSSITRQYGGTGLGLAISKQLVELMGGSVAVRSVPKIGATFSFLLPLELLGEGGAQRKADVQATPAPDSLQGCRILLAEDNEINQFIVRELLGLQDVVLDIANDGLEVLEKLQHNHYDIVLMDIQMPNLDGLNATRQIRQDRRFDSLPIIAMTAHALTTDLEKSLAAGMQDHITKPIDPAKLLQTLRHWWHRG